MPCNGVAVAAGRLPADLARELESIPQAQLTAAIVALLQQQYPALAQASPEPMPAEYYPRRNSLNFKLGSLLVEVAQGQVMVSFARGSRPAPRQGQAITESIKALLTGLAGKARQQALVAALQQAGVTIETQQTAPNGAVVLNVEL